MWWPAPHDDVHANQFGDADQCYRIAPEAGIGGGHEGHDAVFVLDDKKHPAGAIIQMMAETQGVKPSETIKNASLPAPVETVHEKTVIEDMLRLTVNTDVPVSIKNTEGELIGGAPRRVIVEALVRPVDGPAETAAA